MHLAGPSGTGARCITEVLLRGARDGGAGRWPSPRSVLALAVLSPVPLTCTVFPVALPALSRWGSTPPGLRLLHGLCRHLPHPAVPQGVPSVRVHARPLLVQRLAGRSCHPSSATSEDAVLPEEQPLSRCLVPSSRGSGSEPDAWSGWRWSGCFDLPVLPKQGGRSVDPGIVDSSRAARPSSAAVVGEASFPDWLRLTGVVRGRPLRACHVESCRTSLMGGLKDCPSIDIRRACPLPAHCRPRPDEVLTEVSIYGFAVCLRPEAAKPRVSFRPCRFSRLRRLAPRKRCRSVAPCCRPWGSPGCRLPTHPVPARASTCCRGARPGPVASTRVGRRGSILAVSVAPSPEPRRRASGRPLPHRRSEDPLQAAVREHTGRRRAVHFPKEVPDARGVATTSPRCRHLGRVVRGRPSPCPLVASLPVAARQRPAPSAASSTRAGGRDRSPDLRARDVAAAMRSRFRSTGSHLPPRRSLRRGALRSVPLVHSAFIAALRSPRCRLLPLLPRHASMSSPPRAPPSARARRAAPPGHPGRCLLAVAPCRRRTDCRCVAAAAVVRRPPEVDPEAFFRVRVRCRPAACATSRPVAPLGLVLLLQHVSLPTTLGPFD
jgi:hypothetical protein